MSTSNSKATPRPDSHHRARAHSEQSRGDVPQPPPATTPRTPEWTAQWKRQVEAEARRRLKKNLAVLRSDK